MEQTVDQAKINTSKIVLYALAIAPLLYVFLLYLLETINDGSQTSSSDTDISGVLTLILFVISVSQLIIVFRVFVPNAMKAENFGEAFVPMIVSAALLESIGLYGLFLGLYHLFITGNDLPFELIFGFMGVSLLFQFYLLQNRFGLKLQSMLGTEFSPSVRFEE